MTTATNLRFGVYPVVARSFRQAECSGVFSTTVEACPRKWQVPGAAAPAGAIVLRQTSLFASSGGRLVLCGAAKMRFLQATDAVD